MTLIRFNNPATNRSLARKAYLSNLKESYMGSHYDCKDFDYPKFKTTENEDSFNLEISIPGLSKNDIKVEVDNGLLRISTVNTDENKTPNSFTSDFSKEFRLSKSISQDKIDASVDNGILSILLPKKEEEKTKPTREITIS